MFKWGFGKKKRLTPMSSFTFPIRDKVYCKECKHFNRKINDWYYMNREPFPTPNPIPVASRQSDWKWIDQCLHPENQKEVVTYHDNYAEREERRHKNTRRPSTINQDNDCHWYEKSADEPDWEK